MESELCHLVYVARVDVCGDGVDAADGPAGVDVPLTGHTELPTCTVCLERMDESVDGILTILCNHSFHGSCLAKWSDTTSVTPSFPPSLPNLTFQLDIAAYFFPLSKSALAFPVKSGNINLM